MKEVYCAEKINKYLLSDNWLAANEALGKYLGAKYQLGGFIPVIKQFFQK